MIRLDRRDFLVLAVATAAARITRAEGVAPPTRAAESLSRLLPRDLDVARIARAYREQRPEEDTAEQLAAILLAGLEPADERTLRRRLAERSREDFVHGRTLQVRGWLLSLTEARLATLHHLVQQR